MKNVLAKSGSRLMWHPKYTFTKQLNNKRHSSSLLIDIRNIPKVRSDFFVYYMGRLPLYGKDIQAAGDKWLYEDDTMMGRYDTWPPQSINYFKCGKIISGREQKTWHQISVKKVVI